MNGDEITWGGAWNIAGFRKQLLLTCAALALMAFVFPAFFDFIESRSGPQLNDPVMEWLPAADVAWLVFFFQYLGLFAGIASVYRLPVNFLLAMQTYIFVTLLRMVSILLFPLNPPDGYIPMREPIVQLIANDSRIISKDLFFSGHVTTLCSVLFAAGRRWHKYVIGICSASAAVLLMVQRNHYLIDIAVAPFFTYGCYLVAKMLTKKAMQGRGGQVTV